MTANGVEKMILWEDTVSVSQARFKPTGSALPAAVQTMGTRDLILGTPSCPKLAHPAATHGQGWVPQGCRQHLGSHGREGNGLTQTSTKKKSVSARAGIPAAMEGTDLLLPSAPSPDPSRRQHCCMLSRVPSPCSSCQGLQSSQEHSSLLTPPASTEPSSQGHLCSAGRNRASPGQQQLLLPAALHSMQQDMGYKAQQDRGGSIAQAPELGTWPSELANRQTAVESHALHLGFILALLASTGAPQAIGWGLHSGAKPAEPGRAAQGQSCLCNEGTGKSFLPG